MAYNSPYGSLLNTAYQSKLGRTGDDAGMQQWSNQIDAWARSGMSGDQINKTVLDAFGNSAEGQAYTQQSAIPSAQPPADLSQIGRPDINPTASKTGVAPSGPEQQFRASATSATSGAPSGQIQYGQTLDTSLRSGDGGYQNVTRENDGGSYQTVDYKPWTWNTEGQNFASPVDPAFHQQLGMKPIIDNATGKFSGWTDKSGNTWIPKSEYDKMDQLIRMQYGSDPALMEQMRRPSKGQIGDWVAVDAAPREAPAALQHGPNNLMERFVSYSPYMIAAMAAGGAGMALAGGGAAAGAGAAEGMTAAEGAALGSEAAGGVTGIGAGGATAADVGAAAGAGTMGAETAAGTAAAANPYAIGAEELGASMATPGSVAPVAGEGGAATLGTSTATSQASMLSQIQQYVKQGMSVMEAIQKVSGSGQSGSSANGSGARTPGLLDMAGAYYSAQQQKDLAGLLKEPMSSMQGRQDPYNQMLLASYMDPNLFYGSNQWKGLESVYQNSIDRTAAKGGTLANPTDRERLLQAYGMKELENFRNGLRGGVNAYDPSKYAEMFKEGAKAETGANTGAFATAGRMNAKDFIDTIATTGKSAQEIWDLVSKWFTTEG